MTHARTDEDMPTGERSVAISRRRLVVMVMVQFTLIACIVNSLAIQMPGTTPFLVGNMAAVAIALRFGTLPALPVALLATGISGHAELTVLAMLEAVLAGYWRRAGLGAFAAWWRIWLPLAPLAAWVTLPAGIDDPLLWFGAWVLVLATGATSLLGGRQLAQVTPSRRRRARQPMALQLEAQLSTLMAAPATIAIAALLQWGHQHDVQRVGLILDGRAAQLGSDVRSHVVAHRDAVAQAARTVPGLGPERSLDDASAVHPGFLSLLATDAGGRIVSAYRRGEGVVTSDRGVEDRWYFRETMARGKATVSPVFLGRGIGSDVIVAVAAPVFGAGPTPTGIVQGALALGQVARETRDQLDTEGLGYVALDGSGQVAFSSLAQHPPLSTPAMDALEPARIEAPWARPFFGGAPPLRLDPHADQLVAGRRVDGIDWRVEVRQPLRPLQREQVARSLLGVAAVLAIILGMQWVAAAFAQRHTRGLAQVVGRLRDLDPSSGTPRPAAPVAASSAELAELLGDFERTEARLREMHGALSQLNRELEARVEARTAELSDALARAEHLAQAKSGFLANMSHELRTPLAAILGYSERALRDEATAPERQRALQIVVRHGRHLLDIVNDVLDASKIEAGQLRIETTAVATLRGLEDAIELMRPKAVEKGLQLVLSAHWPLPRTVQADGLRLRQVLLNLLSNAIKFTAHGIVVARVRADEASGTWSVEVEDTGIGMDAEQCERVFQRFEQGDDSTTRRFGGTGLGLYISRQLARQMGGELSATSTPGRGSRFLLVLPIGEPAPDWQAEGDALPNAAEAAEPPAPALSGRVLVVDDVDDLRQLLRVQVEACGAEVLEAVNGRDALEAIARHAPDLVLMDMHMPVMDGREAVRRLRADGLALPVYACSADVMERDVAAFVAIGCDGALGKPIDVTALRRVLAQHLEPAGSRPSAASDAGPDAALEAALAAVRQRFVAGIGKERTALAQAASTGDRAALAALAHRLKGSAGTFGFMAVSRVAGALETAARSDAGDLSPHVAALDEALAALH